MPIQDYRASQRFLTEPPIRGAVGRRAVSICNVAERGIQIEHAEPLAVLHEYHLSFSLPQNPGAFEITGTVIWTRLVRGGGGYLYRSGIRIDASQPELGPALMALLEAGVARPDSDSLERKKLAIREKSNQVTGQMFIRRAAPAVSPEQATRVRDAAERLLASPEEIARWSAIGRSGLSGGLGLPKHVITGSTDLAVAIWEYLDHQVELRAIESVLDLLAPPSQS